jgi:acetyl-CoA C-acetyltransferase/potassium large conductance calcium-activated channel subfamily M alpha protein 1
LFNYLSYERNLIPLALYRLWNCKLKCSLPGAVDNKHPYVYTNPPAETKLTHRDKVFVLAHQLPNDLSNLLPNHQ